MMAAMRTTTTVARLLPAALLLLATACAAEADDPASASTSAPASAQTTATLAGDGQMSTDPLHLDAGHYEVHFTYGGTCYFAASLDRLTGGNVGGVGALGSGTGPVEGDTNVYDVEAGEYYVDVITGPAPGCPWEITLSPQP